MRRGHTIFSTETTEGVSGFVSKRRAWRIARRAAQGAPACVIRYRIDSEGYVRVCTRWHLAGLTVDRRRVRRNAKSAAREVE